MRMQLQRLRSGFGLTWASPRGIGIGIEQDEEASLVVCWNR